MANPPPTPPDDQAMVLAVRRLADQMARDRQQAELSRKMLLRRQEALHARGWGHRLPQPLLRPTAWQRLKTWLGALWR